MLRLTGVAVLAAICAAPMAAPSTGHSQNGRIYPTNAQCTEGYAENTVFLHACDNSKTYYCPLAGRYGWDTMCVPLSPEELKARQAAAARLEEERRLAAEAAARRQAMIDEKLKTMGPGRRLEAERFVDMKIAAEKARPPAKKRGICNLVYGSPQEVKLREAEEKRKAEGRPGIPVCPA